jgi:hypothetical protein
LKLIFYLLAFALLAVIAAQPAIVHAEAVFNAPAPDPSTHPIAPEQAPVTYIPPTEVMKLHN